MSLSSTHTSLAPRWQNASGTSLHNTVLFWILYAFILLIPIPFASARPYFWGIAAIYIGVGAVLYAVLLTLTRGQLRFGVNRISLSGLAFLAFCLAMVLQLLPMGENVIVAEGAVRLSTDRISIAPGMTVLMLLRHATYGVFFFLMLQVLANDQRRGQFLDLLIFAVAAYAVYAVVTLRTGDTILGMPKWSYQGLATGTFVNRNSFATFLAIGAALAATRVGSIMVARGRHHPDDGVLPGSMSALLLTLLALGAIFLALVETQSRMGLAAAMAGSALGFLVTLTQTDKTRRLILPAIVVLTGAAIFAFLQFGDSLFDRLLNAGGAAGERMDVYKQIVELIALRPLTGFGGGSFELAFPLVQRDPVNTFVSWDRGHNTYLTLWSEMGLIAGSLPMLIVAVLGIRVGKRLLRSQPVPSFAAQASTLAVIAVVAIHSLADFSLEIPANAVLFLAVLAAGVATLSRPNSGR